MSVCVWDTHSCCRGLYKCKEAVSVCFIRRTSDEVQVENPLHCECVCQCVCACVCIEECTKRGNKNRERGQSGECKGTGSPPPHYHPPLLLFLSLSPLLCVALAAVQMKCGPHVEPRTEGHRPAPPRPPPFSLSPPAAQWPSVNTLHLTLCFNANFLFMSSPRLTCATWHGSLCSRSSRCGHLRKTAAFTLRPRFLWFLSPHATCEKLKVNVFPAA